MIRLEDVASCESAEEAVKEPVVWERKIKRAEELKLVIPDSSRLMSALMKMVGKPLSFDSQLAFRVQLAQSTLEVDLLPTFDKVMRLQKILKGEPQVLAKLDGLKPSKQDPKVKALKTEKDGKSRPKGSSEFKGGGKGGKGGKGEGGAKGKGKGLCRFFNTKEGCGYGQNCNYEHERFDPTVDKDRCFICGGRGRKDLDCTRPKKPRNEEGLLGVTKGNRRDSPPRPTGTGTTPTAGARRMEIPPMPGSSSGDDKKEDEKSIVTEPDLESEMSATLRRLMQNPKISNGERQLLNSLGGITDKATLKMIKLSKIFSGKGKWECWTVEPRVQ